MALFFKVKSAADAHDMAVRGPSIAPVCQPQPVLKPKGLLSLSPAMQDGTRSGFTCTPRLTQGCANPGLVDGSPLGFKAARVRSQNTPHSGWSTGFSLGVAVNHAQAPGTTTRSSTAADRKSHRECSVRTRQDRRHDSFRHPQPKGCTPAALPQRPDHAEALPLR